MNVKLKHSMEILGETIRDKFTFAKQLTNFLDLLAAS